MQTGKAALEAERHKLTEQLYQQSAQQEEPQEAGVGAATGGNDEDVIDAEFKEEK